MLHDVCALSELPDGGLKSVRVGGKGLVLVRRGDEVFALRNRCAHMKLPLGVGSLDGDHLVCRFHGARFDVRTGNLDKKAWLAGGFGGDCVPVFPVSIEEGRVRVEV